MTTCFRSFVAVAACAAACASTSQDADCGPTCPRVAGYGEPCGGTAPVCGEGLQCSHADSTGHRIGNPDSPGTCRAGAGATCRGLGDGPHECMYPLVCASAGTCGAAVQPATCPGAGVNTPAAGLCSCDGGAAISCAPGQSCPEPVHGHATYCCADPDIVCQGDEDCCSYVCLLDTGVCSAAAPAGALCHADADCAAGTCDPSLGECAPLVAGAPCRASSECANASCVAGLCTCLPAGAALPASVDVETCCSQTAGAGADGVVRCG